MTAHTDTMVAFNSPEAHGPFAHPPPDEEIHR